MVAMYALGQFMAPLEQEFGWSRTQASVGLSISLVLGFLASPVVGRIVDRTNARWLALPGLVLLGFAIAAFSLASGNMALWIALWCLHSLAGALVGPPMWLAVISAPFERNRSLAIAICLCGTAIGSGFGPPLARYLLNAYDWRTAFQMLGFLWIMPALVFSALFFFDRRPREARTPSSAHRAPSGGQAVSRALRSATFIKMGAAIAVTGTAASAFSIHMAPALASQGMSAAQAATFAGIAGLSSVPGKLVAGSLFDRYGAGRVAVLIMALFALACALLAIGVGHLAVTVATCVVFGMAVGANFALSALLTARLFDASIFGVIYGTLMSVSALGAAIGPLAISAVYDLSGSYSPAFWAGVAAAIMGAWLMSNLSPVDESDVAAP